MLSLKYYSYELAFEYPFVTHHGAKTHQPTLITSLGLGGLTGYGEAPAIHYYNVTVAGMVDVLLAKRPMIERYALTDPQRFWHFLHHLIPGQHFLTAALDIAGWDLFAKMRRMPLHRLIGAEWQRAPISDYTLGVDTTENMVAKLKAHPWPVYKIKMDAPADIDKLRALRQHTTAPFRVDANEALTPGDARALLPELQLLNVTLLEQPLARADNDAMAELMAISPIPIFADESCCTEADVKACAGRFHGINIKLTKCGGITPALRMIREARALGMQVMIGSMNESSVGSAAIAHLSPLADMADADGPMLLSEDLAEGLTYRDCVLTPGDNPGLGVRFTGKISKQG